MNVVGHGGTDLDYNKASTVVKFKQRQKWKTIEIESKKKHFYCIYHNVSFSK